MGCAKARRACAGTIDVLGCACQNDSQRAPLGATRTTQRMKTAYELAMERLNKTAPGVKLTAEQKAAIADLESKYKAKIAAREIFLQGELAKAREAGDVDALVQLERQLVSERRKFAEELDEKKEQVRCGG